MSGGVRRVWVTVLVGLLGLVVGLTIGFTLGLSRRKVDAVWLEAVGTWFGAGVTLTAVILATIAFFSEEFARRREHRRQQVADLEAWEANMRQQVADLEAKVGKEDMLQREANLVFCDAHPSTSHGTSAGKIIVDQLEVAVVNRSSHVITGLACHVPLGGIGWIDLREALGPEEPSARQIIQPPTALEVNADFGDLRGSAEFKFSLAGVSWSKRHGQPAQRIP
jgi:hypothetical protein